MLAIFYYWSHSDTRYTSTGGTESEQNDLSRTICRQPTRRASSIMHFIEDCHLIHRILTGKTDHLICSGTYFNNGISIFRESFVTVVGRIYDEEAPSSLHANRLPASLRQTPRPHTKSSRISTSIPGTINRLIYCIKCRRLCELDTRNTNPDESQFGFISVA